MSQWEMTSVPGIAFAHTFGTEAYHAQLLGRPGFMEITYVTEGELVLERKGKKSIARKGDVVCNLYESDLTVSSSSYHCHHTVGFFFGADLLCGREQNRAAAVLSAW